MKIWPPPLENNHHPPFDPEAFNEVFRLLSTLGEDPVHYLIVGGQAVNIWANYFFANGCQELADHEPFTSRDCDIWVDYEAFRQLESLFESSTITRSESPIDGQLAIVKTNDEPALVIDFLSLIFGIKRGSIPRIQKRAIRISGIYVLDPLYLLKAKCNNLANLPQAGRQDEKHVKMLLHIVSAHLELVYNSLQEGEVSERDVIKEFKLLLEFEKDHSVRKVMQELNRKLADLLPGASDPSFPKLLQFLETIRYETSQ